MFGVDGYAVYEIRKREECDSCSYSEVYETYEHILIACNGK